MPLSFSERQVRALKQAAGSLPVESRAEFVRLVVGFLEVENCGTSDGSFARATKFALDACMAARSTDCCGDCC
jgi:hypothetical protein